MKKVILETQKLTKKFGGTIAIKNCSIQVGSGSVVGLVGPNGSGKTTLFNLINGIYKPDAGKVFLKGEDITGLYPYKIMRKGVVRMFQTPRIFRKLTLFENLLVPTIPINAPKKSAIERATHMLELFGLIHLKEEFAENLSGGQQRLLEFARAAMTDAEIFLLDEPFAGVHPEVVERLSQHIKDLNRAGKTFIVVSHELEYLMPLCEEVIVLNYGEVIAHGRSEEVVENDAVVEAYLGI